MTGLLLLAAALAASPATDELELARFRIVFTPRAEGTAALLSRTLEAERDELARRLGRDWGGRTLVLVGEGTEELAAIAPAGVRPPRWAAGMAFPSANVLLFDARALRGDGALRLLRHEMAHLALARAAPGAWPRWFQEGFAMLVAGEWSLTRYYAMYRASLAESAIPLAAIERQWPDGLSEVEVAYAQSYSFVAHLYEKGGEERFRGLIDAVAAGAPFEEAFAAVYEAAVEAEERSWRQTLSSRYSWVPVIANTTTLWTAIIALFLVAFVRHRRRQRRRLEAMGLEEQAREAALRIAAAEAAQATKTERPLDEPVPDDPPTTLH